MNGLQIACRDKYYDGLEVKLVYPGLWGSWKEWVYFPDGHFGKAARVRFENACGDDCDDTALNGIQFK